MMYSRKLPNALAALLVVLFACDPGGPNVIEVDADGAIAGVAYLDRNGNGQLETTDAPAPGISVRFAPVGTQGTSSTVISNPAGGFVVGQVAVGEYQVTVESASVPDSLQLIRIDSSRVRVTAGDTSSVFVILSFPTMTARQARTAAIGRRAFVEAVTLNSWTTYGDSTLHLSDSSGVIRATRVAASSVGSSQRVRLLGTTDIRDGQRTLTDATVFPLGSGQLPAPVRLTTTVAARADQARLDAALVQVVTATILGGQTIATGDFVLTVNDGSGLLEVLLDRNSGIATSGFVPGSLLDATGLLVPSNKPGEWWLKPRATNDLNVAFPTATVAEARALPQGRLVSIEGVALNSWVTFGDATVHLHDATGDIRAVNVQQANLFAGDRVRLVGTIAFIDGQPILNNATASVLGQGLLPLPILLSTSLATTADAGARDAALVKIVNGIIADTATIPVTLDFRVRVNDGSGLLEILLDRNAGFQLTPFVPGVVLDVTGLLVPILGGRDWRLKPRQPADIVVVR